MNNRRQPIPGKRLWSINTLNKYLAKRFNVDRLGLIPDNTIISLWNHGYRIIIQPVTVWRKMKIRLASEERMTYIAMETIIPMTRYHVDIIKLDDKTIKRESHKPQRRHKNENHYNIG